MVDFEAALATSEEAKKSFDGLWDVQWLLTRAAFKIRVNAINAALIQMKLALIQAEEEIAKKDQEIARLMKTS